MPKSYVSIFRQVIDNYMESFETAMPGLIAKVNDNGTVDVTPSIRNCLSNMQLQNGGGDLEPIPEVPVLWPGTANAVIKMELKKGDPVLLVASSRDLSKWAQGDWGEGPFNPLSFSGNDLNDLVALPMRRPDGAAVKTTIEIKADGKVNITTNEIEFKAAKLRVTGKIEADGEITTNAAGYPVALSGHMHPTAVPGSPSVPNPSTPSDPGV